jgi:23S rRNA (cytosine1962-C5)-methyltransferase
MEEPLKTHLLKALATRPDLLETDHLAALRLFNGFYEGIPELIVDLYARTLVLFNYGKASSPNNTMLAEAQRILIDAFPWVKTVIQKERNVPDLALRKGVITYGNSPAQQIIEFNVHYALDLQINQDASFYLDTRDLRRWLLDHAAGWRVLNMFAYTGSLGVAALAAGASRVVQGDRSRVFLALARQSAMLNRLDLGKMKTPAVDFFRHVSQLKGSGGLFDCVILDPPFFSTTSKGVVDQVNESVRLINKVRPLIRDGGYLVAINNSLFLSGADYMGSLEKLCSDGYLSVEMLIPVPQDVTGYPETVVNPAPCDPAPFNHPTKIAILRVRRR